MARPGLCHLVPQLVNPLLVDPVLGKVEEEVAFPELHPIACVFVKVYDF